ncbi:hypothetical protein PHYSODRAFT_327819 [Phytophthora sojae]|uniref:Uncharacterized protein n=1 Tax=Phytophthora sojae (strain P6497) TaxID=1094619 RepID=G4Z7B4_PHYSP|nr:hypothetical protein PHYSODRAFT_327819 [Phytophthora sojae]EGZ19622.1 hypothetical protein PHYSODRAFT_327819 [Phytophthora sojae]|eukprot:XP_009522339.1 hypothetical protein PHYSODRAFT_327819 [Phytophthora sojae]
MIRLEQALLSWEHAERDYAVLEDRVADSAEALLRAERGSSTEQYRDLQTQLRAARDQVTDLTAQLARAPVQARVAAAEAERDHMQQLVATAEQHRDATLAERDRVTRVLVVVEQERDGALDMRDQVRRASTALRRERDAAVAERDQARQAVAALEQRRDAAVAERDQARQALTALEQQRAPVDEELRVARASLSQSRMVIEAAQNLNVPLQDCLRRVNALLVAHVEELRRGATRIHELEESVATATTLRVGAESEMARGQAGELCATSRAMQYRAGWLSIRRSSQQRRGAVGAQTHRLSAYVAELEEERDLTIRELDEYTVAWRRMLRDARRGRELARRVRDELANRLAGVVTRVGGQIDTSDLVRRLEATFTAEIDGASRSPLLFLRPQQFLQHPRFLFLLQLRRALVPGRARLLRRRARRLALALQQVLRAPVLFRLRPLSRPRRVFSDLDTARRVVRVLSHARLGRQEWLPLRHLASSAATPSAAAAAAARAREDASLFGSESSDSEDQARRAQPKRHTPAFPFCFAFAFTLGLSFAFALASTLALLGVDALGRLNAFGASVASRHSSPARLTHSSPRSRAAAGAGPGPGPGDSGDSSGDDASASSSSRASSSSTASSGSAGSAPAAPFFDPVIPPAGTPSGWRQPRYAPWPKRELQTLFLPPPGWIIPRRVPPAPANWNRALVTLANVDALQATRPWRYLAQAAEALLFASGDAPFRPFLRRLRHHIEHWAQAYWESTHELSVQGAAWKRWRTARNSRRSHAGNHLNSLLPLVVGLFQQGLADVDLLLDPMVLHFPPAHMSIGRWYPGLQHATLQAALNDIDAQEPWRRSIGRRSLWPRWTPTYAVE